MRSRLTAAAVSAAVAIATAVVLGLLGWPQPGRTFEFSGLVVAAILAAALAIDRPWVDDLATMPPSFVVDFAALLLLGPHAAMLVVATGMVMPGLLQSASPRPTLRMLLNVAVVLAATQAAGFVYQQVGGAFTNPTEFSWPWQRDADRGRHRSVLHREDSAG